MGVTVRHYVERLRLAPDTSAVLQPMVEIGAAELEAEGRGEMPGGEDDAVEVAMPVEGACVVERADGYSDGWEQLAFEGLL